MDIGFDLPITRVRLKMTKGSTVFNEENKYCLNASKHMQADRQYFWMLMLAKGINQPTNQTITEPLKNETILYNSPANRPSFQVKEL